MSTADDDLAESNERLAGRVEYYQAKATLERHAKQDAEARLVEAQATLTAIRASLGEVAVYKGLSIGSGESLVLHVNELVRDHEELERRIDLAMMECSAGSVLLSEDIGRILQGAVATPDGLDGVDPL
jgi:hypothetical protein